MLAGGAAHAPRDRRRPARDSRGLVRDSSAHLAQRFISGDLALDFHGQIYGNKIVGVINRFLGLYELPMQLAVLGAIVIAVVRRELTWLTLLLASALWVAIEIAFAYHGWPASQRYLMEPAAVCVALAGAAVGRVVGFAAYGGSLPGLRRGSAQAEPVLWVLRILGVCMVSGLIVALAPVVRARANLWRTEINHAKGVAVAIDRLTSAVQLAGGPAAITSCGDPISYVGFQSDLAWNVGLNVGRIGYKVRDAFASGKPIVFFRPVDGGWQVRFVHQRRAMRAACRRLDVMYDLPAPIGTAVQATRVPLGMVREFATLKRAVRLALIFAAPVHHRVVRHEPVRRPHASRPHARRRGAHQATHRVGARRHGARGRVKPRSAPHGHRKPAARAKPPAHATPHRKPSGPF